MIDDKSVTDIQMKVNIFNIFFTNQSTPLKNNSELPTSQMFLTPSRLCILNFSEEEIMRIIRNLLGIMVMMIFSFERLRYVTNQY